MHNLTTQQLCMGTKRRASYTWRNGRKEKEIVVVEVVVCASETVTMSWNALREKNFSPWATYKQHKKERASSRMRNYCRNQNERKELFIAIVVECVL